MFLSPPSAMSSLLLDPNSATYRRTGNDSVLNNFGAEIVTEPLASTTMGSPHNIRTMGKHPHLHSIIDQDGLTIRSFPEPSIPCPSTTIWQQFINEDQCSEQAPPQGGPSRQPPRWTGNQAIITDTPLSPSQALPELRNFWTPRSPCNDLSPFASPLSDTSYLSEASNSPYTPSFQEFGYLPPHSPNHDQWGSPNHVDITSFSLLGLDGDDVADYNGMHLLDTTQRNPIGDGEQKDLSPLAGLFYFENSVETTHPNIQINHHHPSCSPMEASPEVAIKLEISPPAPNSPLPVVQYGDLLSPSPPSPAPRPSNQRRKNARQSKRFSPHLSKSPKQPRDSSSTLQPKDKHSREELDRVFTFVKSLRDREEDVRLAKGINSHELGGGGDQSAQTKSRTMEYLRDFWNRTYEEWTSFQQFFADEVVADYILSQSPENAVASAAILRASEARRSRPSKYWCPKWCGATFTSPDRAYSHLLSHEKMRPYHCSLCSETFGTPDVRNRHEVTKHKLVKPGKAVRRNP